MTNRAGSVDAKTAFEGVYAGMKVLIVDDEPGNCTFLERILSRYETHSFVDPRKALEFARSNDITLVITDQHMPYLSGIELVREVAAGRNDFAALVISTNSDNEALIDAVNSNLIYKFIIKPFPPEVLLQHVHRALEYVSLNTHKDLLEKELRRRDGAATVENNALETGVEDPLIGFVGNHRTIIQLKDAARTYARSDIPVLVTGETGTGKEVLARAIHALSRRATAPFVAINCAALPDYLVESELFGSEAGAFTGSAGAKKGLIRSADGGTLFLDEVGDLPPHVQAKILRVLQFGTFYPVGSSKEHQADLRIISATNREIDLSDLSGALRQDLLYRLNAAHLHIPPLRERTEDVPMILAHLAGRRGIRRFALSADAEELLRTHSFPGNVRELENLFERMQLNLRHRSLVNKAVPAELVRKVLYRPRYDEGCTEEKELPSGPPAPVTDRVSETDPMPAVLSEGFSLGEYISDVEKRIIASAIRHSNGNLSRTARLLKISRQGLKNKMRRNGLRE